VEHASLNPMGGKVKAGCPYRNVQATLNALIEEGFSVAVYEEVGQTASNKLKTRVLSQIVSPASPTYLYDHNWLLGSNHEGGAILDQLPPPRPCVGIVHTVAGYHMVECSLEERSVEYSERLTSEAVACRLAAYPPAEPLVYIPLPTETSSSLPFLPWSTRSSHSTEQDLVETHLGGYRLRTVILPPHLVPSTDGPESERYTHAVVETLLKWNEKRHDDRHHDHSSASRPRGSTIPEYRTTPQDFTITQTSTHTHPLYLETANQLGLLQDPAIPSLIASVLDEAAPAVTRRFLKRYLLVPPPPNVAQAMAEVIRCLMHENSNNVVMPRLAVPPLGKVLSLIRAGQASAAIYGELLHTLAVTRFVMSHDHSLPVNELLTLCSHESGIVAEHNSLRLRCERAMAAIEAIICLSHHVDDEMLSLEGEYYSRPFSGGDPLARYRYLPASFVERNEMSWRGRVQREVAAEAYQDVEDAGRRLDNAIARDFIKGDESNQALIVQDIFNNMLVLKKVPSSASPKDYTHPRDRHGKKLATRFSTEDVEQALSDYVSACDRACESVSSILSNLARTLQDDGHLIAIIQAAHLNLALSAAYHHAVKATKQNWQLARIIEPVDHGAGKSDSFGTFADLWPYWMPKQGAVSNTFDLNGMFLLTAPNMSGKSTLMRATAAAALLSVCGLCAPLSEGSRIPRFDTLFLRGASADVPAENKSAFGAEMEDIAALMRCCGPRSLVFVDEIGRGTSPRDGARLAAAILEAMSSRGMSGIFATHLHEILGLPLRSRDRIVTKRMAIDQAVEGDASYEWTYRLEDGVCRDSLATLTAKRFGLPCEIIERADELGEYLSPSHPIDAMQMLHEESKYENAHVGRSGMDSVNDVPNGTTTSEAISFKKVITLAQESTNLPAITIPRKANPPPALANKSCVYILELACRPPRYYVGETDAIFQRLLSHRKKGPVWSNCRAAVVQVASKSEARLLESRIIQEMARAGYSLESTRDGRNIFR
jgi:MutS domain V